MVTRFAAKNSTAGEIGDLVTVGRKYPALLRYATSAQSDLSASAYIVRALERHGLRNYAVLPLPGGSVVSPFDEDVHCGTPEALLAEYGKHTDAQTVKKHVDEMVTALGRDKEVIDEVSQINLQFLDLTPMPNGGYSLSGYLPSTTGALFAKFLRTAGVIPRQEDADSDGVLPSITWRNAEAFHHLVADYAVSPLAHTRHGHTAQLSLLVDVETLRGKDTGRIPMLDGHPTTVSMARLLSCEAGIIPMVFNFKKGEVLELGREHRLPTVALRRVLEAEQPDGCGWPGCYTTVEWCEAHHLEHWADGGTTDKDNLGLLCRIHHGQIHTGQYQIMKAGPGTFNIINIETGEPGDSRANCPHGGMYCYHGMNLFPTDMHYNDWSDAHRDEFEDIVYATMKRQKEAEADRAAKEAADKKAAEPDTATATEAGTEENSEHDDNISKRASNNNSVFVNPLGANAKASIHIWFTHSRDVSTGVHSYNLAEENINPDEEYSVGEGFDHFDENGQPANWFDRHMIFLLDDAPTSTFGPDPDLDIFAKHSQSISAASQSGETSRSSNAKDNAGNGGWPEIPPFLWCPRR